MRTQDRSCHITHAAAVDTSPTGTLPEQLSKIVTAFSMVPDPKIKYQQLLYYAKKLGPFAAENQTKEHKVEGCVSQVWVVPEMRDGKVYWSADSDSQLTKGLAALLVQGLSGVPPTDIVRISPDFITTMGLAQSLTPSRNNGFLNMFRLMQKKSLELVMQSQDSQTSASAASTSAPEAPAQPAEPSNGARQSPAESSSSANGGSPSAQGEASNTPVQDSMRRKLTEALNPLRLVIEDQSSQHAGHVGSRMKPGYSGETHFRVAVVSPEFEGLNTVKRHRMVYQLLGVELAGSVHALSLETQTPTEADN